MQRDVGKMRKKDEVEADSYFSKGLEAPSLLYLIRTSKNLTMRSPSKTKKQLRCLRATGAGSACFSAPANSRLQSKFLLLSEGKRSTPIATVCPLALVPIDHPRIVPASPSACFGP